MKYAALAVLLALVPARGAHRRAAVWQISRAEGRILVTMATCKTAACVNAAYVRLSKPDSVARLVYFSRLLELKPANRAAAKGLLESLPRTDRQQYKLALLGTFLYPGESESDLTTVNDISGAPRLYTNLEHALSLYPRGLRAFLAYGPVAPEKAYSRLAARVCRSNPPTFSETFSGLSATGQEYFRRYLVRPEGCELVGRLPWEIPKTEGPLLVAMATCKSVRCVKAAYTKITRPEIVAKIVYYTNILRFDPGESAASCGLLANIPATGNEYDRLSTLTGFVYANETTRAIEAVAQAYWGMSKNLARALKACPRFLPAFIRYGRVAVQNHQDDYPDWAARVCRSNPSRFLKAFETLSPKDRHYIARYVIQPRGCKQIAIVAQ